jgi:FG-GAP-like repeat
VSVVLSSTPGYAAAAPSPEVKAFPGTLTLRGETLAARVTAAPLGQVMAEFSRLSGAKILWRTPVGTELVSVDFPALPLAEALTRLLREKNFVLFYTAAGQGMRLTQIWISAREKSQRRPLPEHRSTEAVGTPPSSPVSLPRPPRQGDKRSHQAALDAQGPSARSEGSTRRGGESQEDLEEKPMSSQAAHNNSSPQGQEAAGVARLQGGVALSGAGVAPQCVPTAATTRFVDVDGDGRADAIALNEEGITVRRSTGSRFSNQEPWTTEFSYGARGTDFADVDGDGRADVIAVNEEGITVRRSNGGRFLNEEAWTTQAYYGVRGTFFATWMGIAGPMPLPSARKGSPSAAPTATGSSMNNRG